MLAGILEIRCQISTLSDSEIQFRQSDLYTLINRRIKDNK